MRLSLGYPDKSHEIEILKTYHSIQDLNRIKAVASKEDILAMQNEVDSIYVHHDVLEYIVNIVNATRISKSL